MKSKIRGFTLIELLVTITIIAILMAIAISAYMGFQKNARDAKRKSDLATIQSALEQYHADKLYYPAKAEVTPGAPLSSGTRTYLNNIPGDPSGSPQYSYDAVQADGSGCVISGTSCSRYCLYAQMENASNATLNTTCSSPLAVFDKPYSVSSP